MGFKKNVGMIDRSVRLGAGIALIIGGLTYFTEPVSYVLALVGLVLLVTGFTSSCLLYSILGISTAGKRMEAAVAKPSESMQAEEAAVATPKKKKRRKQR